MTFYPKYGHIRRSKITRDIRTDERTDGAKDEHNLLKRCVAVFKRMYELHTDNDNDTVRFVRPCHESAARGEIVRISVHVSIDIGLIKAL